MEAVGDGQGAGPGTGSGVPPQPEVSPVRCIPPGNQQMPVRHAHNHQPFLYKMSPNIGDLIPPKLPRPPYQPAPHPHSGSPRGPAPAAREPRAEPARMTAARRRGGPARRRRHRHRNRGRSRRGGRLSPGLGRDPPPPGGQGRPPGDGVFGWLSSATSETTRALGNGPSDAMRLWRD